MQKLDPITIKEWEAKLNEVDNNKVVPTVSQLIKFLIIKHSILEAIVPKNNSTPQRSRQIGKTFISTNAKCSNCQRAHYLYECDNFLKPNATERNNYARKTKHCINCLKQEHFANDCLSKQTCKRCNGKHYTTLHLERKDNTNNNIRQKELTSTATAANCINSSIGREVLLSTALIEATDANGKKHYYQRY